MRKPRSLDRKTIRELQGFPSLFDDREIDMTADTVIADSVDTAIVEVSADNSPDNPLTLNWEAEDPTEKLFFMSFGSGSDGNCAYLGTKKQGILIDVGVNNRIVEKELAQNGIDIKGIRDIYLTHEHGDHVRFVYSLVRKNKHMRIKCTRRTLDGMQTRHSFTNNIRNYHEPIFKEYTYLSAGMEVTPFEVSHDADTVGFFITFGQGENRHVFVICPDTGEITPRADEYLRQARYIMIESNYDLEMLMKGPYPEHLKARVASIKGHMDNKVTAKYLAKIYTPKLSHVFLSHLSAHNNTPELALNTVKFTLEAAGITVGAADCSPESESKMIQLCTLPRHNPSPLYVFRRSDYKPDKDLDNE